MQLAPIEPVQVVVECGSLERAHALRPAAVTEGAVTPAANSTADMFADKSATLAATVEPASTSVSTTSVVSCERDVEESRLLAAHVCVRLYNATDYHLYFQQHLVDLYESNYRRATEILHAPSSHPTVGPSQPTVSNAVTDPAQLPIIGHEDDDEAKRRQL